MMFRDNLIAVVVCGDILRESKDGVVQIPFGSEYTLRFKNKDSRRAVVNVNIDGVDVTNGRIVVPGGGTVDLDGFMENATVKNRFRFIQKTKQIKDYRGDKIDDGIITIQYQFEQDIRPIFLVNTPSYPANPHPWRPQNPWGTDIVYGSSGSSGSSMDNVKISCSVNQLSTKSALRSTKSVTLQDFGVDEVPAQDEGITVKGSEMNQQWNSVNVGPLEPSTHTMSLILKGFTGGKAVSKPIGVRTKLVCSSCGTQNKSSSKHCSECGTFLSK